MKEEMSRKCKYNKKAPGCSCADVSESKLSDLLAELNLYKQALTKSVSLPKGQLPHESGKYYTVMLNGNVVVKKDYSPELLCPACHHYPLKLKSKKNCVTPSEVVAYCTNCIYEENI